MSETDASPEQASPTPPEPEVRERGANAIVDTAVTTALAIILALLIGAVLIAVSNKDVIEAMGYFGSYPWDTFTRAADAIGTSYVALVEGSVGSIGSVRETLAKAAPLICAGLGVSLAFRSGMFNIGAQGQMLVGAMAAGYIGFRWDLPPGIHLLVAVIGAVVAAGLYGAIAGLLKAKAGAHEVISTIMLNHIGGFLLAYALAQEAFQITGSDEPLSPRVADSARFPEIFGVHSGVLLAILAAFLMWWILERSTLGFELRSVGNNPDASRTAGMSVAKVYTLAMLLAGGFAGLAATMQINGDGAQLSDSLVGTIGFDAITVALLGRGSPIGTVLAGLLFGALQVGGISMQASPAGTPPELALVLQSLIVLFVAAPALVRHLVRIRDEQSTTFTAKGATE
ncbi:MAG: ABC transporter permease [Nocardioides sp.]|nr:ABC transporter permease [Nocardioides sp.]